jgi:cell division protein FtsI/penicillin-binding protein 2
MEEDRSPRSSPTGKWAYLVAPVLVVVLLGVCYLDSISTPPGFLRMVLLEGLGISLVARNAEAGTSPGDDGPAPIPDEVLQALDLSEAREMDGRFVQLLGSGTEVVYTIDPALQAAAGKILDKGELMSGAIVLVDSRSGRILVAASSGSPLTVDGKEPEEGAEVPAAFSAEAPAASVFKVVTSAALVETAGLGADEKVCYWGGSQKLKLANLEDDPKKDKSCATLGFALGKSINSVFAKLADRHLDRSILEKTATGFGFGEVLPLDYPVSPEKSRMDIPEDRLEFARTAAGFWHVHLTPLHGAFLAQSIAQDGAMLRPLIVDEIRSVEGDVEWISEPRWLRRVVSKDAASVLTAMMINTTTKGTARKYFKDKSGIPYLPDIKVAGKTGTLTRAKPYRAYTWFVGFAPADDPEVAVAALAVNTPKWKVKATAMARDILRKYFKSKKKAQPKPGP